MTQAQADVRVVDLRELTPNRWFDVGRSPTDLAAATERTRSELALASPWALRLVALDGSTVVGRLGGYVAPTGALRLWSIGYRDTLTEAGRDHVAEALVSSAVQIARERLDVRFVESRPGHDSPDLHRLLTALEGGGLRPVSQAHVYSAPVAACPRDCGGPPGLELARMASLDDRILALYERTRGATLDRADAQRLEPLDAVRAELERQAPKRRTWVARVDEVLTGFLWASVDSEDREAWILDVGVDPDHRRRGIGRALLARALTDLAEAGVSTVLALIDDENHPSIALHEHAGLRRSKGPFWTYRLVLR